MGPIRAEGWRGIARRVLACALSALMLLSTAAPATAAAQATSVTLERHSQPVGREELSGIRIGDVDAPRDGEQLDDRATVHADQDVSWDIPVLWVSDELELADQAEPGHTYLSVLAFFVPQDCALADGSHTVELVDELAALMGDDEIVSVYDAATGITYILPASLRHLFAAAPSPVRAEVAGPSLPPAQTAGDATTNDALAPTQDFSLVDIYCAQTARDALTDEDLAWLIDLIVNRLEPQAIELLLNSFPAFRAAAERGEIGRGIGLYIYYLEGDSEGVPEHMNPSAASALAFVYYGVVNRDGTNRIGYMLGINLKEFLVEDAHERPVRNPATGKLILSRDRVDMATLENTLIHELVHALMVDYVRTGMTGAISTDDYALLMGTGPVPTDVNNRFARLFLPTWFSEGVASVTENVYQFRTKLFDGLRMSGGKVQPSFSPSTLVSSYLAGRIDGKDIFYDLSYCNVTTADVAYGNEPSAYVCGYLATLYLANLASINETGTSAITVRDGVVRDVSAAALRAGLNTILERLHAGESLDRVIEDIAPVDAAGTKAYTNTSEFQSRFIKGALILGPDGIQGYSPEGDVPSSYFVADYLNYLNQVSSTPGRKTKANGSILMPIDTDRDSPLDASQTASSDYLKVEPTNRVVESTAPDDVAYVSGGTSDLEEVVAPASAEQEPQAMAARVEPLAGEDATPSAGAQTDDKSTPGEALVDAASAHEGGDGSGNGLLGDGVKLGRADFGTQIAICAQSDAAPEGNFAYLSDCSMTNAQLATAR